VTPDWRFACGRWSEELRELRRIVLDVGLTETLKWRQPCYPPEGKNIVILGTLKDSCVLRFFRGAMVEDPSGLLQEDRLPS